MIRTLVISLCLLGTTLAYAEGKAENKKIIFSADEIHFNQKTHEILCTGHLHLSQGSSDLQAETALMLLNKNQVQKAILNAKSPRLVRFETQRKADEPPIKGQAKTIIYDLNSHTVHLKGQAIITQGKNHFSAPWLIYHLDSKEIETKNENHERTVITVFHDQTKTFSFNSLKK